MKDCNLVGDACIVLLLDIGIGLPMSALKCQYCRKCNYYQYFRDCIIISGLASSIKSMFGLGKYPSSLTLRGLHCFSCTQNAQAVSCLAYHIVAIRSVPTDTNSLSLLAIDNETTLCICSRVQEIVGTLFHVAK